MKILILDKNDGVRECLLHEFISQGHEVMETDSSESAIQIFNHFNPDVLLCGASLKYGNILQFLKEIRSKFGNDSKIYIMSMYSPYSDTSIYIKFGANKFFDKNEGYQPIFDFILNLHLD